MDLSSIHYPNATPPDKGSGGVVTSCLHCSNDIRITRWDSWNGFLVRCPLCTRLTGKHMRRSAVIWASFFLNAVSFFFTLRPRNALAMFSAFFVVGLALYMLMGREYFSPIVEVGFASLFMLGPAVVNGGLLVVHEANLRHPQSDGIVKLSELLENILQLLT